MIFEVSLHLLVTLYFEKEHGVSHYELCISDKGACLLEYIYILPLDPT